MRTRRELLTRLGLGAAGITLASSGGSAQAARRATLRAFASGGSDSRAPWWLLEPLSPGDHVGSGFSVEDLSPVRGGAAVLTLRHPVRGTLSIHICSHEGQPQGYAYSEFFDLIVMDGGRGSGSVDPQVAAMFQHIAFQLRNNELRDDHAAQMRDIERMMTHRERVAVFGPIQLQ